MSDILNGCLKRVMATLHIIMIFTIYGACLYGEQNPNLRIIFDIKPDPLNEPVFDWLQKESICWGIEVPWYADEAEVRRLRRKGWEVLVHLHANPDTLKRHWEYKKRGVPDIDDVLHKHIGAADGQESKVNWLMFIEDDSCGVGFPQELLRAKPTTHAGANALLDEYLEKTTSVARRYPELPKWGMCGFASSTHAFASQGLDWLILERANDDVDDLQTGIAFARGAANQYGCNWGLDLSLWWGVFYGCVQDLPTSYHKRHLYLGYFSGAKAFRIEGGDLFWNRGEKRAAALADTIKEFANFTQRIPAGRPDVPVAVMLPADHGWMTPPYWRIANEAWSYSGIPYRPGDRGIDGFFASAFPGSNFCMEPFPFGSYAVDEPPASPFSLSCVTPQFAPSPEDVITAPNPIPFGRFENRDMARKAMNAVSMNPAPYRPMGDSRWGDIFDILTTKANTEVISRYKAVILLGNITFTGELKEKLTSYVSRGGIVVCATGVVGPNDKEFTGLIIQPEFRVGRAWSRTGEEIVAEPYHYLPVDPIGNSTSVLAKTATGQPLVTQTKLGSGLVYTCTIPWYEGPLGQFTGPSLYMMDRVIGPLQPVTVKGLPVEWLSTEGKDHKTVVIANHSEHVWVGEVTVNNYSVSWMDCIELLSDRSMSFSVDQGRYIVKLEIPPYDLRILRWHSIGH